jgi:ribosome-associated heat shock protein Hsp15
MRIDKFIWTVRLCKTRSIASKECSSEKVKLNGDFVKGSKSVKIGDEVGIKINPIWKTYKVLGIPKSRVGAKFLPDLIFETTPALDLEMLEHVQELNRKNRFDGLRGRPTKRDRRKLDGFKE